MFLSCFLLWWLTHRNNIGFQTIEFVEAPKNRFSLPIPHARCQKERSQIAISIPFPDNTHFVEAPKNRICIPDPHARTQKERSQIAISISFLWITRRTNYRPAARHESWTSTLHLSREQYSGRAPPPPSNYVAYTPRITINTFFLLFCNVG